MTGQWLRNLEKLYGPDWLALVRKLGETKPVLVESFIPSAQKIISGEALAGISYVKYVQLYGKDGAPIDYVPVQPVVARPQGIGVARGAPHPNAAILFAEFVLSPDGQQLFESMGRVPASTKIKSEFNKFPFVVIDPVTVLDEAAKWEKEWNDLFVRR